MCLIAYNMKEFSKSFGLLWATSCVVHSVYPIVVLSCLEEGRWLTPQHLCASAFAPGVPFFVVPTVTLVARIWDPANSEGAREGRTPTRDANPMGVSRAFKVVRMQATIFAVSVVVIGLTYLDWCPEAGMSGLQVVSMTAVGIFLQWRSDG